MLLTNWILFAILARFFMAATNVIDQYIARVFGHRRIVSAIVLQNVMAGISVILIPVFYGLPPAIDGGALLWINLGVICYLCALYPYLKALQVDEARNVIPLFELTPIVMMVLAFFMFGETMTWVQGLLAVALVGAGFLFLWDYKEGKFKSKTFLLMMMSATLMALFFLSMRHTSQQYDPITILWLIDTGLFVSGIVMTIVYPRALGNIKLAIASTRGKIILFELLNGALIRIVSLCMIVALAAAPSTGLVAAFSGTQPVFVFLFALFALKFSATHFKSFILDTDTKIKIGLLIVIVLLSAGIHLVT